MRSAIIIVFQRNGSCRLISGSVLRSQDGPADLLPAIAAAVEAWLPLTTLALDRCGRRSSLRSCSASLLSDSPAGLCPLRPSTPPE